MKKGTRAKGGSEGRKETAFPPCFSVLLSLAPFFGLLTIFCHVMDKSTDEYRALHPVRANIQRPIIRSLQNKVKSTLLRSIHF